MKRYHVSAVVSLRVERIIYAESLKDADEIAQNIGLTEWLDYVEREDIDDVFCYELPPEDQL